ncbi:MAG: NPCBM/NEW2 domain-containing protein [Lentisphaeria bacterium]|nr:NPCBM/NEW2 domain-containing protein [Lentisphaeria bacterium]
MAPGRTVLALLMLICLQACRTPRSQPSRVAAPRPVEWTGMRHEIGSPTLDRDLAGGTLRIGSVSFARGICVQAPARIELALGPGCERFAARVGVDMAAKRKGHVAFAVLLDGREAYRSEVLAQGAEAVQIEVPLAGASRLALLVEEAGIVVGDMAVWAEPVMTMANGGRIDLAAELAAQGFPPPRPDREPRTGARVCDVRDFGARGDGVGDDTDAFRRALDTLAGAAHGVLHVPPGSYRIRRRIEVVLGPAAGPRSGLTVRGDGQGVSNLLCDSGEGLFRLTDPAGVTQFSLHDVSLVALRENCGTALDLAMPGRGVRSYRTLTVANVDIRGDDASRGHAFAVGIDAAGHWRPLFRNVIVQGAGSRAPGEDGGARGGGGCGIRADWCYAPAFEHCYVWGVETGYSILCRHAPEGPEDASFIRCTAVGCSVGIDIETPIPEPQLLVTGCHINCSQIGIRLHNRKFFTITDNLMYSAVPSETPYTDILIDGRSHCGLVTGNIFHFSGRDVYRAEPASARIHVLVGADVHDVAISGNVFNAKGTMVRADPRSRRITTDGNHVSNTHAR